jgi:hypothetical protein
MMTSNKRPGIAVIGWLIHAGRVPDIAATLTVTMTVPIAISRYDTIKNLLAYP